MSTNNIFALISFLIIIAVTIPYMVDIVKGRAQPARAARAMFLLLIVVTLAQQYSLESGLAMTVTLAETISSILLFGLAIKYGVGGFSRSDKACYALLVISLITWALTRNALLALHVSIIADTVAYSSLFCDCLSSISCCSQSSRGAADKTKKCIIESMR